MSFETAAELAAFFATDMGAESASCTPSGGVATGCTVILDATIDTASVGLAGISEQNLRLVVRKSEIADPRAGTFTAIASLGASNIYTVAEADLDPAQAVWTCSLRPNF